MMSEELYALLRSEGVVPPLESDDDCSLPPSSPSSSLDSSSPSSSSTRPDQMIIVLDAGGARPLAAARAAATVVDLARTLAAHFPGRLATLYVLARGAPSGVVSWPLAAAGPLLHPETRKKIVAVGAGEEEWGRALPRVAAEALREVEREEEEARRAAKRSSSSFF